MNTYKFKPISYYDVTDNPSKYNGHCHHEYDPYVYDNHLYIDVDWYNTLTPYIQNLIKERTKDTKFTLRTISYPHVYNKHESELAVYRSYLDGYDCQHWTKNIKIRIMPEEKRILSQLTWKKIAEAESIDFKELDSLRSRINSQLGENKETQWFMKLSGTSGKNEQTLEPILTVDDIFKRLTSNILFLHQEYDRLEKDTYLILIPWDDSIQKRNEFRVFICNSRVTGISQQHWYELFSYTEEELNIVVAAIKDISFDAYTNCVVDIWVDFDNEKANLIEYNPFGAGCGAGSSLFDWITDRDRLYGLTEEPVELRFTSLIMYEFECTH